MDHGELRTVESRMKRRRSKRATPAELESTWWNFWLAIEREHLMPGAPEVAMQAALEYPTHAARCYAAIARSLWAVDFERAKIAP